VALGDVLERTTDVLVVGGGIAGLWSAIEAKRLGGEGMDVLVVEKGPQLGFAGQVVHSAGGIQAVPPGADVQEHVRDAAYLGDGLYEQDLLEAIFAASWETVTEFQRLGVTFMKRADGGIQYVPQRGLQHLFCFMVEPYGGGGEQMAQGLAAEARRLGVGYLNRVYITRLLLEDGMVAGAVGFHTRTGEVLVLRAKAVVLATGTTGMKGHYEDTAMSCGDGIALGAAVGAELKNMEFATVWVIPQRFRWEGVTYLLPLGAEFVDRDGVPFANKYSPAMKSNIDYNYLARFMALEARAGRGPFYLDCSPMTPEARRLMEPVAGWPGLQYRKLLAAGVRPFEEPQEWCPGVWSFAGGLHSDLAMETNVPGLFVAGKARNVDPGIYFGGWSHCVASATGRWAGRNAARRAQERAPVRLREEDVALARRDILRTVVRDGDGTTATALAELQETIFAADVLILKEEKRLAAALSRIQALEEEVASGIAVRGPRDLMRFYELKNMVMIAKLFLSASLMREETRASHYREDFPRRDDARWTKWIFVRFQDGVPIFEPREVPTGSYRHQLEGFYMDNFRWPGSEVGVGQFA
jgi:succinate dehydrogenase/fumarate reductase flavoprotein subunit